MYIGTTWIIKGSRNLERRKNTGVGVGWKIFMEDYGLIWALKMGWPFVMEGRREVFWKVFCRRAIKCKGIDVREDVL